MTELSSKALFFGNKSNKSVWLPQIASALIEEISRSMACGLLLMHGEIFADQIRVAYSLLETRLERSVQLKCLLDI